MESLHMVRVRWVLLLLAGVLCATLLAIPTAHTTTTHAQSLHAVLSQSRTRYFPETGHFLRGTFLSYWERNGGLGRFGYPITEEYIRDDDQKVVQYFERARMELRLVNGVPQVDLGLLGSEYAHQMDYPSTIPFQPIEPIPDTGTQRYIAQSGHSMHGGFKSFWEWNGGLGVFGYPISEQFLEAFPNGQALLVQYFERARLERHPDGSVHMGLLGPVLAPCHQMTPRAPNDPPPGPLPEGHNDPCIVVDRHKGTIYDKENPEEIPGYTLGVAPRGRVYPTVVQPGTVQGFEGWDFLPGENVTLWLNKPDGSTTGIPYKASADRTGYVLIGFQTEQSAPQGQWSLVAKGENSGLLVVAPFELRW